MSPVKPSALVQANAVRRALYALETVSGSYRPDSQRLRQADADRVNLAAAIETLEKVWASERELSALEAAVRADVAIRLAGGGLTAVLVEGEHAVGAVHD